jgi:hypothetical protein
MYSSDHGKPILSLAAQDERLEAVKGLSSQTAMIDTIASCRQQQEQSEL